MPGSEKLLLHSRIEKIRQELRINNKGISTAAKKEKFQKMAVSPYTFYRGSNHLYWEDFYNDWRINFFGGNASSLTWINGDAHIYNYGAYANHDGEAIFCMDDFDDAIVSDYQFDLWRMAISLVLDCRNNATFNTKYQKGALTTFAYAYLREITHHHKDDPNNSFHWTKKTSSGLLQKFLKKVEKKKSRLKMLNKWTQSIDGERHFDFENEKLDKLETDQYQQIEKAIKEYRKTINPPFPTESIHFNVKDIARRIRSGTGSLGSDRFYVLLEGDTTSPDDDVIIDMKQQNKPPLYRHMNKTEKKEYDEVFPNEGERHARAYKALAEHPDQYLGWIDLHDKQFSLKERSPFKSDFPTESLTKSKHLLFMADVWGSILATRHKRASYVLNDDAHEMPIAIQKATHGKEKDFVKLVQNIAFQYADRVDADYKYFVELLESKETAAGLV
ncbi:MAG: DUF2252 family protein [Bacteroidota bacterium]